MRVTDFAKVAQLKEQRDSLISQRSAAIDADTVEGYNISNAIKGNIVCAAWSDNDVTSGLFAAIRDAMDKQFTALIAEKSTALEKLGVELDDAF